MSTVYRSQAVQPGDTVVLRAHFRDSTGALSDLDVYPSITIIQPSGGVLLGPTSAGMARLSTGIYEFRYSVGLHPPIGVWTDLWRGILNGFELLGEFTFLVWMSQTAGPNSDGYVALGDDPGYDYSQTGINNINHLMKSLRARLKSQGKSRSIDQYGNVVYRDCDVYDVDELVAFIAQSLSMFNEVPHFTFFTFDDTPIIEQFFDVLVQGSVLIALSSQALIERGKEMAINDNGVGFTPPTISELLNTQWSAELNNWWDKVKMIKMNMRASPIGLGSLHFLGVAPQIRRMRTYRARQIY